MSGRPIFVAQLSRTSHRLPAGRTGKVEPDSPLSKGDAPKGAGIVLIFEDSSKMLIARDSDSLIPGVPVFQDNPQTAAPSLPLTKGEFPLNAR